MGGTTEDYGEWGGTTENYGELHVEGPELRQLRLNYGKLWQKGLLMKSYTRWFKKKVGYTSPRGARWPALRSHTAILTSIFHAFHSHSSSQISREPNMSS